MTISLGFMRDLPGFPAPRPETAPPELTEALRRAGIAMVPARSPTDYSFLLSLFSETREEELMGVPWTADEKAGFLAQQFAAQHIHYIRNYDLTGFFLITRDGIPIGRLYLDRGPVEFRIVDISVIGFARGQGLGSAIMSSIFAEADAAGLPVTIHVEFNNPAQRLYRRLGFIQKTFKQPYYLMERPAMGG
jgi:ribosomal protein S18 acetylase RimI-like enzyme